MDCESRPDAAAFVLYALEDDEAAAFVEHLASCTACREDVAQLQGIADALAAGVPRVDVPPGLGARIVAPAFTEAELLRAAGHDADRAAPVRPYRRGLVPALASVLALGVGLLVGALAFDNGPARERTELIRALVVTARGGSITGATANLRRIGSQLELIVEGMPAPPRGRIYEVWLEHGSEAPEPTDALFSVTKTGAGSVAVPGDLRGVSQVLVTDEPLGGSLKPTRKPVIVAKV
jgi:hypothetical protein